MLSRFVILSMAVLCVAPGCSNRSASTTAVASAAPAVTDVASPMATTNVSVPTATFTAANAPTVCNGSADGATAGTTIKNGMSRVAGLLSADAPASAPPTSVPDEACARANAYVGKLATLRSVLPEPQDDLNLLVRSAPAGDADALDILVRDNVRLDAYRGTMRGPLGTWLGRAGSPADKVSLLSALLGKAGIRFTIVHGTLSDAEIAKLRALAQASSAPALATAPDPALVAALGISQPEATATSATMQGQIVDYLSAGVKASNDTADALIARLRGSGLTIAPIDPEARWSDVLRPHDWIQLANGDDLDPSAPDLAPGSHLGTVASAQADNATTDAGEVATVRFRVVTTTTRGAAQNDAVVLDVTRPVSETQGTIVGVGIEPPASATIDGLAAVRTFTPRFTLGSTSVDGTPIVIGSSDATLRSAWLEIVSTMPGEKPVTYTRMLTDNESDPAIQAVHLARGFHIAVQAEASNPTLEAQRTLDFAIGSRSLIEYASSVRSDAKPPNLNSAPNPYPIELVEYFERGAVVDDALARADNVRFAYDRPQIAMLVNGFDRRAGKTVTQQRIDIVENGMAALASDPAAAFRANVARGVADTYLEGQIIDGGTQPSDTPALMRLATTQNVPLVVLNGTSPRVVGMDDRTAGALTHTFALGQVAIAPARVVLTTAGGSDYGWWAIDPLTGASVGRMSSGAGQELAEEDVTYYAAINHALTFINLGWTVARCMTGSTAECHQAICNFAVSGALGIAGGAAGGAALGKGLGGAVGGTVLGGMPGPGPGLGSSGCAMAFPS
jgi:hypothetical protein